jgi:GNAT superfamily N-acetyltransferase
VSEPFTVRPFREADLPEVLEVLRLSLGEPPGLTRTPDLFAWKHFGNPFGRSLMLVAEASGQIAGFRAFMRWDLAQPGGMMLRCVRAVDTATHPDFQRRGIFRLLTLAGIEVAISQGIDLIFNTPNEKSGAGYLTMGWSEIGAIGVMVRPGFGAIRPKRHNAAWNLSPRQAIDDVLSEDALTEFGTRSSAGLRTPRTPAYLRWRFSSHPTANYLFAQQGASAAIGRAHIRNGRRELVVSEVVGSRGHDAVAILRKESRPDYAVAWFSPGAPERRIMVRSGLLPVPRYSALRLVARPLRELESDLSWARWDLSLGDLELL